MSACFVKNEKLQIYLNSSIVSKTRFRGTAIKVENLGHTTVRLPKYKEEYRMTNPDVFMRGIMTGRIFAELVGPSEIFSSGPYSAHIDFVGCASF